MEQGGEDVRLEQPKLNLKAREKHAGLDVQ